MAKRKKSLQYLLLLILSLHNANTQMIMIMPGLPPPTPSCNLIFYSNLTIQTRWTRWILWQHSLDMQK